MYSKLLSGLVKIRKLHLDITSLYSHRGIERLSQPGLFLVVRVTTEMGRLVDCLCLWRFPLDYQWLVGTLAYHCFWHNGNESAYTDISSRFYPTSSAIQSRGKNPSKHLFYGFWFFHLFIYISPHHTVIQIISCQNQSQDLGSLLAWRAHTAERKNVKDLPFSDNDKRSVGGGEWAIARGCSDRSRGVWKLTSQENSERTQQQLGVRPCRGAELQFWCERHQKGWKDQ